MISHIATFATIFFSMILVNNYVLVQFLGICPFLGVSKKLDSSVGMGAAVIVVMVIATAVTFPLQIFLLDAYDLGYLQTIIFILVIAVLVQLIEITLRKYIPALYQSLGVYLPLITTNCCVLGVTILAVQDYSSVVAEYGLRPCLCRGSDLLRRCRCRLPRSHAAVLRRAFPCRELQPAGELQGPAHHAGFRRHHLPELHGLRWSGRKHHQRDILRKGNKENEPDRICYRCRGGAGPGRRRDPCAGLQIHGRV